MQAYPAPGWLCWGVHVHSERPQLRRLYRVDLTSAVNPGAIEQGVDEALFDAPPATAWVDRYQCPIQRNFFYLEDPVERPDGWRCGRCGSHYPAQAKAEACCYSLLTDRDRHAAGGRPWEERSVQRT